MTNRDHEVIETTRSRVKLIPNSPILGNKHELRGIVVNKGRIHREIGEFLEILSNLIKSDNEMVIEIRPFNIFIKKTQRRIHIIKNHSIWISIRGEIIE